MAREAMGVCLRVLKESNKSRFDSYSVRKSVLIISHITFRNCRVHSFSDNLSRNSCIHRSPWNNCKATSRPGMFSLSCKHDKPEKTFIMIYFFYVILALQKGSSVAKFGLQWLRTTSRRVLRPRRNNWRLFNCFYNADLYKALIKRYGVGKLFKGPTI